MSKLHMKNALKIISQQDVEWASFSLQGFMRACLIGTRIAPTVHSYLQQTTEEMDLLGSPVATHRAQQQVGKRKKRMGHYVKLYMSVGLFFNPNPNRTDQKCQ